MMGLHPVSTLSILAPASFRIAHMMLKHGANVNAKNNNGLAPFGLASRGRRAEVVRALGADSDGHNNFCT
jgi:hypothetical protein